VVTFTIDQATAFVVAVTGLLGAVVAVYLQVRQTHALVNSRMTELLETTRSASLAQGQLVRQAVPPPTPPA